MKFDRVDFLEFMSSQLIYILKHPPLAMPWHCYQIHFSAAASSPKSRVAAVIFISKIMSLPYFVAHIRSARILRILLDVTVDLVALDLV